jgi:hypothetical protein
VCDDTTAPARPEVPSLQRPRPARRFAVLPQQASCPSATDGSSSGVCARPFPQPVWTTWRRNTRACVVPAAAVCPGSGAGLPSPGLPAAGDALVTDGCGMRLSGVPGTPGRTAVNGPVSTALRRQGRLVARAAGPRHHRPRLRHRTRRRGPASAASRPTQSSRTHGRIGIPVCTAVGGPVRVAAEAALPRDCPRGLLGSQTTYWFPVGAATRSNGRGALPYQPAPREAPKPGTGAAALCPCRGCLPPPNTPSWGLCGAQTLLPVRRLCRFLSRVLCGLSSLLVSVWNVLPPGSCVKAWPCGAHQQNGHDGLTAPEGRRVYQAGCGGGGPWWQALGMRVDRQRTCVPDEALAVAGGPCGGNVPPPPSCVAALPG